MRFLATIALAALVVSTCAAPAQADNFGVIFSGGVDARNNYVRYYNNTLRIWELWTDVLGYDDGKVWVLYADGTATGDDTNKGSWLSPDLFDSDWSSVTGNAVQAATRSNLEALLEDLADTMGTDDCFHFWSFDHGGNPTWDDDPPTAATEDAGYLCAWNDGGYKINDDVFASWVDPIEAYAESYWFGQCFAGDMADDLNILPGENRFASWAADWTEPSWGDGWVDALADGIESGLTMTWELAAYAKNNDLFLGSEHPGWTGDNFDVITNHPAVPEPATITLFGLGAVAVLWVRRRRSR